MYVSRPISSFKCHSLQLSRSLSTRGAIPLIIAGKDVQSEKVFDVTSPVTGKLAWRASSAGANDVARAIETAQQAFPAWSSTKPSERRDILLKASDLMEKRRQELAEYMHVEIGATKEYQDFIISLSIEGVRDTAGKISDAVTGYVPVSNLPHTKAIIHRKPYGVNLAIAPWNAPYQLGFRSVIFPLAAGNTTILKGSELSPKCHWAIVDIFRQAGLPSGCLNLLYHSPSDGPKVTETLIAHPAIRKINFTGSTRVGRIIASTAGQHLKPVVMELGGKANAIVLKDADLKHAAEQCVRGAFLNAGQICMSTERILVDSTILADFKHKFQEAARNVIGQEPAIVVNKTAVDRNRSLIADAVSKGAQYVEVSGPRAKSTDESIPTKMTPVVLTDVTRDMEIYQTESFGPTVSIIAYEEEEEAIRLANDTDYGLSASIYSSDLNKAFSLAERIESGAVHINSMTVHDEYALPHGGVKDSGFGRFNGVQGLEEFLHWKTVTWMDQ